MIEVYVDDFMSLVIPVSQSQLMHVAAAVMTGIHDIFPANEDDNGDDPISEKKLKQLEAQYATLKALLGFGFDGINKTMWLESAKREKLLTILRGWICTGHRGTAGNQFKEFESTIAKIRHTFTCIPMGASLLSPCNRILKRQPPYVYLHRNKRLLTAVEGCRTLLRESTKESQHAADSWLPGGLITSALLTPQAMGRAESLSASCRLASPQSFGGNGRQT